MEERIVFSATGHRTREYPDAKERSWIPPYPINKNQLKIDQKLNVRAETTTTKNP